MGFLDKAKAAASELAAKADSAITSATSGGASAPTAGDADKYFRDLGVLTYLEATARPVDGTEHARVMATLRDLDERGALRSFDLHTTPPPPPGTAAQVPPPPGAAGVAPPPPGGTGVAPPPPPAGYGTVPPAPAGTPVPEATADEPPAAPQPPVAPPPPPSWA